MSDAKEIELENVPTDSISRVKWSPVDDDLLLVASWDTSLRLYNVSTNTMQAKFEHKAAVLSASFSPSGNEVISGGLDCWLRLWSPEVQAFRTLSTHDKAISSVLWSSENNLVYTGSWDSTLATHDSRLANARTGSYTLPDRVYFMDTVGYNLVVGMASRKFSIYDIRNMERPRHERESSLRFMTGALACMPNGEGYAVGSIEGRVAVEYFDLSPAIQAKKYAFKCHRQTVDGFDHVWPVNALAFHPVYHTFASAGSDGLVSIWDHTAKKRLKQYPKYHNAINDIAFNKSGTKAAIAVSYAWDKGEPGSHLPENSNISVYVRDVGDEVKPKKK